ncbi:MAG: hypothetical protein HQK79_22705 [Desulfobacterales bacterium]|nr:hypothetical protein [Desulfobacterales bacterium]
MSDMNVTLHDSFENQPVYNKCGNYVKDLRKSKDGKVLLKLDLYNNLKNAASRLNTIIKDLKPIQLGPGRPKPLDSAIEWRTVSTGKDKNDEYISFNVSHYIGTLKLDIGTENNVIFNIKPRFGEEVLGLLLEHAFSIYLPKDFSANVDSNTQTTHWLLPLLWRTRLSEAMAKFHIPREYQQREGNLPTLKGRLLIGQHLRHNIVNQHLFYCSYYKYEYDNLINRAIRYSYRLLMEKEGMGNMIAEYEEFDNRLASFGVLDTVEKPEEIEKIRYTRMTEGYQPLMRLCQQIISRQKSGVGGENESIDSGFLVDISEIWENYILKVLEKYLPQEGYNIVCPNHEDEETWLLEGSRREIRPDFLIYSNGECVAILDAKYKYKDKIGYTSKEDGAISKEDIYAMNTYALHYHKPGQKMLCLFVTPEEMPTYKTENEFNGLEKIKVDGPHEYSHSNDLKLGVIRMPLPKKNDNSIDDAILAHWIDIWQQCFANTLMELIVNFKAKSK